MPTASQRRFGPVTYAASVLSACFGGVAKVIQLIYFPPGDGDREVIVTGILLGALTGIVLGSLWEAGILPKQRVIRASKITACFALAAALLVTAVVLLRQGYLRYQQNLVDSERELVLACGGMHLSEGRLFFKGGHVIDDDLTPLQDLEGIESLTLTETRVTGPGLQSISRWQSLRDLSLGHNPIGDEGLAHLGALKGLVSLDLYRTRITDEGLRHLNGLTKLEELSLSETSISDSGLRHLSSLNRLHTLRLWDTRVSDEGLQFLSGLKNLKQLGLGATLVTDAGLKQLESLTSLESLSFLETSVTQEACDRLREALPNCRISCGTLEDAMRTMRPPVEGGGYGGDYYE